MKNLKPLLIPVSLIVLVVGIFSFTNHNDGDDEKCKIKIIKIVDGVKTEVDSTFDCSKKMEWLSSFGGAKGDSLHKMIKMMMVEGGDSNSFSFDINIESNDEDVMKFTGEDGEEIDMHFDMKMLDGDDGGVMKMMINGKEMEIKLGDIEKHIKVLTEDIQHFEDDEGNVEVTIDTKDGKDSHTVKIIKTVDDDGNVSVKKIVDGEETKLDDEDMVKMSGGHKMMFISNNGEVTKMDGNHEMTIDVNVESDNGKEVKQIVVISKMTSSDKSSENLPSSVDLNKKELGVEKLKFSPNPNDGNFELNFRLKEEKPVQLKIVDLKGKEVYNELISDFNGKYSNKIDISENGKGIYILQIIQGNKASTNKIVIK